MNKKVFIPETNQFVRQVVKLAIDLPKDKIGKQAKRELIAASTLSLSKLNLAVIEGNNKEAVEKVGIALEQLAKVRFWLEFLAEEGYLETLSIAALVKKIEYLTRELVDIKHEDEKHIPVSYPGEWFLDD